MVEDTSAQKNVAEKLGNLFVQATTKFRVWLKRSVSHPEQFSKIFRDMLWSLQFATIAHSEDVITLWFDLMELMRVTHEQCVREWAHEILVEFIGMRHLVEIVAEHGGFRALAVEYRGMGPEYIVVSSGAVSEIQAILVRLSLSISLRFPEFAATILLDHKVADTISKMIADDALSSSLRKELSRRFRQLCRLFEQSWRNRPPPHQRVSQLRNPHEYHTFLRHQQQQHKHLKQHPKCLNQQQRQYLEQQQQLYLEQQQKQQLDQQKKQQLEQQQKQQLEQQQEQHLEQQQKQFLEQQQQQQQPSQRKIVQQKRVEIEAVVKNSSSQELYQEPVSARLLQAHHPQQTQPQRVSQLRKQEQFVQGQHGPGQHLESVPPDRRADYVQLVPGSHLRAQRVQETFFQQGRVRDLRAAEQGQLQAQQCGTQRLPRIVQHEAQNHHHGNTGSKDYPQTPVPTGVETPPVEPPIRGFKGGNMQVVQDSELKNPRLRRKQRSMHGPESQRRVFHDGGDPTGAGGSTASMGRTTRTAIRELDERPNPQDPKMVLREEDPQTSRPHQSQQYSTSAQPRAEAQSSWQGPRPEEQSVHIGRATLRGAQEISHKQHSGSSLDAVPELQVSWSQEMLQEQNRLLELHKDLQSELEVQRRQHLLLLRAAALRYKRSVDELRLLKDRSRSQGPIALHHGAMKPQEASRRDIKFAPGQPQVHVGFRQSMNQEQISQVYRTLPEHTNPPAGSWAPRKLEVWQLPCEELVRMQTERGHLHPPLVTNGEYLIHG